MSNFFIITLLFTSLSLVGQIKTKSKLLNTEINFIEGKTVKLIASNTSIETYLISSESKSFEYTLTITKESNANLTFKDFKGDEYKESYLQTCNCKIIDSHDKKYLKGLKSYQINTVVNNDPQDLYGFVDNYEKNGNAYSFVYLSIKENYKAFEDDYYYTLNLIDPDLIN